MQSDGNLNIQHHLLEPENFYGKRVILPIPLMKRLKKRFIPYQISMNKLIKIFQLYQLLKVLKVKEKNSLEAILHLLQKLSSQKMVELYSVLPPIIQDKISQKCLKYNLKIKIKPNNLHGKLHGDSLLDLLEL